MIWFRVNSFGLIFELVLTSILNKFWNEATSGKIVNLEDKNDKKT